MNISAKEQFWRKFGMKTPEIREKPVDFHWKCKKCGNIIQAYAKDHEVWCCYQEMLLLNGAKK